MQFGTEMREIQPDEPRATSDVDNRVSEVARNHRIEEFRDCTRVAVLANVDPTRFVGGCPFRIQPSVVLGSLYRVRLVKPDLVVTHEVSIAEDSPERWRAGKNFADKGDVSPPVPIPLRT